MGMGRGAGRVANAAHGGHVAAPTHDAPHHVIVYPGLAAGDGSTGPLRGFPERSGYEVHGWYQGCQSRSAQGRV